MPSIEIRRAQGGIPARTASPTASGLPVSDGIGRGLSDVGGALQEVGRKINVARDNSYITESAIKASEEIAIFRKKFEQEQETADGYADAYIQQVDSIYDSYINNSPSEEAANSLKQRFGAQRINEFTNAAYTESKIKVNQSLRSGEEALNSLSSLVFSNPGDLQGHLSQAQDLKDSARSYLSLEQQQEFDLRVDRTVARSHIMGLSEESPSRARDALKGPEATSLFSQEELADLDRNIEATQRQKQRVFDQFLADQKEEQSRDLTIKAIQGELSVSDLADSNLSGSEIRAINNIRSSGNFSGNEIAYRKKYTEISQRRQRGETTSNEELLALLDPAKTAQPISIKQYEELRKEVDGAYDDIVGKWLDSVEPVFLKKNAFGVVDPKGAQQFFLLEQELKKRVENKSKGLSTQQLLTPGGQFYIGDELISEYQRNITDIMSDQINELRAATRQEKGLDAMSPEQRQEKAKSRLMELLGGQGE